MNEFRRQRSLTESTSFAYCEAKNALSPQNLADSLTIIGLGQTDAEKKKFLTENSFLRAGFERAQSLFNFEGKFSQSSLTSTDHDTLFVGTGQISDLTPRKLLHLGAKIAQQCEKVKKKKIIIWIDSFFKDVAKNQQPKDFAGRPLNDRPLSREDALERLITGFFLGVYKTPNAKNFEKKSNNKDKPKLEITFVSKNLKKDKVLKAAADALIKAEATYWARDEIGIPPNALTPEIFVKDIRNLLEKNSVKVKVLDEKRLAQEGFGGIIAVGKGSENQPRLVIAEYNSQSKGPHLVLVGKGVTFDTGGISLKPAPAMHEMKMDMSGAAIVAATLGAIAQHKLPLKVTVLIPIVENRPSHNSLLPGDVYKAWGGLTVEVQNTDAEGRLILGDCLAYAQALKADVVMDLATLTGAAAVTLGPAAFLLYGNRSEWTERFQKTVRYAGEESWEMPLFEEYAEDLRSSVAHIRNHVGHRDGNSHVAAAFLNHFVDNKYPWLHLDICSYTLSHKWKGAHCPAEVPVGLPTLAMIEFAKRMALKQK